MPHWAFQVHSSGYRNPGQLPPGAVLVVGSAASGCQIAEDLQEGGRQVYLAVGSHRRMVRRYRGRDIIRWAMKIGHLDRTVESVSPQGEPSLFSRASTEATISMSGVLPRRA